MQRGVLADYFLGVAAKRLSDVEANLSISNQHEFNGVGELRVLLGEPPTARQFPTTFIYLTDTDDEPVFETAFLTWYDARRNHPSRTEWRLYFPKTTVSELAGSGDVLVIGLRSDDTLLAIVAEGGSTVSNQMLWLFGIDIVSSPGFSVRAELEAEQEQLGYTSRLILESIGVEVDIVEEDLLDQMISRFGEKFPRSSEFSAFAREVAGYSDATLDPDAALMAWMDKEEILFRTLEKHLVAERLVAGFEGDVDGFLSYSLSVQNRRKSRAGLALENHLGAIFESMKFQFSRSARTEGNAKPDFLFPGAAEYHDPLFPSTSLTMLGAKSTCKDRWRQVLSEAARVDRKHLLTLETAISTNQTEEMNSHKIQLVLPQSLHSTYLTNQQLWLMNLREFCEHVGRRH